MAASRLADHVILRIQPAQALFILPALTAVLISCAIIFHISPSSVVCRVSRALPLSLWAQYNERVTAPITWC
jgi:hypothetical protein